MRQYAVIWCVLVALVILRRLFRRTSVRQRNPLSFRGRHTKLFGPYTESRLERGHRKSTIKPSFFGADFDGTGSSGLH